jgi:transcriptional regulator with XRE-family HTH domain
MQTNKGAVELRGWRLAAGKTQFSLAVETLIPQSAICRYESGKCLPSRRRALLLEAVAGVHPSAWDEIVERTE